MDIGLLLLRVAIGLTLAAHGAQKLFGWFGGFGLERTGQMMTVLGFQPGARHAFRAGAVEFGAGLLLAIGLLTPVAAMFVASVMLVAAVSAHLKRGFFMSNGGYEYSFVLGVAGLVPAFTGPGAISADAALVIATQGVEWGAAAAFVALVGAAVQLSQRRPAAPAQTVEAAA